MSRRLGWAAAWVWVVALPGVASAGGAWETMIHALSYPDLLAEGDTVWCATLEAGLLEFSRTSSRFDERVREPGALASNHLTALALDRSRRLWVGTQGAGVSIFSANRASWGLVNAFDGLPSDTITVLEAEGDTMWVGTTAGIALWNGREISGVLPDGTNPSPFASDHVTGVVQRNGRLWVATLNGVYRSDLASGLAVWTAVNAGLPTRAVGALASDGSSLLALDDRRIHRLDEIASQWSPIGDLGDVLGLSDDHGTALAASRRGLFRWNGTAWDSLNGALRPGASSDSLFAVAVDEQGRAVAANRTGLYLQPEGPGPWTPFLAPGPPGNDILNLEIDGPRVYVTTYDQGVGRFDGSQWKHWLPIQGATSSDTTFRNPLFPYALLVDRKGKKWLGCWESALESFDDSVSPPQFTHQWSSVPGIPCHGDTVVLHTLAWASCLDSSGGHWFGMSDFGRCEGPALGLELYDSLGIYAASFRAENSGLRDNRVRALTTSRNGRIWIGYAGAGIDYFDGLSANGSLVQLRHVGDTDNLIVEGLVAHGDAVWAVTTSRQVLRYDLSGDPVSSFIVPDRPSQQGVRPIDVASDGTVWVGTENGIYLFAPDGSFQHFTTTNSPLADDDVRAIRVDPALRVVWIGTAGGMNRFQIGYVPPPPPRLPRLELRVFPNPIRISALGIGLRLSGNATGYRGRVYDLSGRVVARFTAEANGQVIWNGRDLHGRLVKPGIYLVQAEAGGSRGSARVALVR